MWIVNEIVSSYAGSHMAGSLRKHVLALLSALLLTLYASTSLSANDYYRAYFSDTINGRAYRPFAYRAFYPLLLRFTSNSLPETVKTKLTSFGKSNLLAKGLVNLNRIREPYIPAYMLFLGLTVASFYGFFLILRALVSHFYPGISPPLADAWMFFALVPIALMITVYFYVYDPGLWLTFNLAFLCMIRRQWPLFLASFFLCTFNKESSLLLIPLLYLWMDSESPKTRRIVVLLSGFIWFMTFAWLRYLYGSNRGSFLEFHLFDQWVDPKTPQLLFSFACIVPWLFLLSAHRWKEKPLVLRQGLLLTFIPLFLIMLVFGYVLEMRDYYECFVFTYLLAIPSMQSILNRFRARFLPTQMA